VRLELPDAVGADFLEAFDAVPLPEVNL